MSDPTATLEVIDVTVTPLATPLRLASTSFLSSLKEVEGQIAALEVSDDTTAQLAATLTQRLTKAGNLLEATREALKAPVLEQGRAIDAAAKGPQTRIQAAKAKLQGQLTAYDFRQRQKAEEAERARQAELKRLEALRLADKAAAKKRADELAAAAAKKAAEDLAAARAAETPVIDMDFDDEPLPPQEPPPKTATELEIERVQHTPAVVAAKPIGIAYRVRLIHRVASVAALPDIFVNKTANDTAIRKTFCDGWREGEPVPECAGVTFEVQRTAVATGKNEF